MTGIYPTIIYPPGIKVDEETKKNTQEFFKNTEGPTQSRSPKNRSRGFRYRDDVVLHLTKGSLCLEAKDFSGYTVLHRGVEDKIPLPAIQRLIDAGSDVNAQNRGQSILCTAFLAHQKKLTDALMKADADIEWRDDNGNTMLHFIKDASRPISLEWLLSRGPNLNVENKNGTVPLEQDSFKNYKPLQQWQALYAGFANNHTPPESAEDVYHMLSVYPLKDPTMHVDRKAHLRQIFSSAKWKSHEQASGIIKQLHEDGTINAVFAEELTGLIKDVVAKISKPAGRVI